MYARQITPPSAEALLLPDSAQNFTSPYSFYNSSPDSVITNTTNITSPEKSPRSPIIQHGPPLLPKVRCQDQITEPTSGPMLHKRHASNASSHFQATLFPYDRLQRPTIARRETSPPSATDLYSPASVISSSCSAYDSAFGSALNSPIAFNPPQPRRSSLAHVRSSSASAVRSHRGHARSASSGSVDESVLGRFGFPTYRNMPQYIPAASSSGTTSAATVTSNYVTSLPQPQSYSHVPQLQMPQAPRNAQITQYPVQSSIIAPIETAVQPFATDISFDVVSGGSATTCLMDYLTAANPAPTLVRRIVANTMRGLHPWFDVRNLRSWDAFNINTVTSIESILPLLRVAVNEMQLPVPSRPNLQPESEAALRDVYRDFHLAKVNAALRVAQGESHMVMRTTKSVPGSRPQPDFISNYQSDYEKTIFGDGRGRVVGIVRAYDQWNSSMRSDSAATQVKYLAGLAALHHHMREHGCRYGFIVTEIELLCVRAGGPPPTESNDFHAAKNNGVPVFGYLETAPPIRLSTYGIDAETGLPRMTADLALWYLHMLAKENPLPGVACTWRMDVGGPTALTRQNCLERDSWMPKASEMEKREARRLRGWVWPEEPLSRKEVGRVKRGRR